MRIVQSPNDFADAFIGAQREAAASFGVNTILLEKYITKPRHIEVQVFSIISLNALICELSTRTCLSMKIFIISLFIHSWNHLQEGDLGGWIRHICFHLHK